MPKIYTEGNYLVIENPNYTPYPKDLLRYSEDGTKFEASTDTNNTSIKVRFSGIQENL